MTASEIAGLGWTLNIIFAVLCGIITQGKHRGFGIGFLWGFLLGPIGLIIVACMKAGVNPQLAMLGTQTQRRPETLRCGPCGANINRQMNVCPMCATPIAWEAMQAPAKRVQRPQRRKRMR